MNRQTPPIPPNCPYFTQMSDDSICFNWPTFGIGHFVTPCTDLFNSEKYERPIIAAVARCAWLDEAERIRIQDKDLIDKLTEAYCVQPMANAEAWRAWGEKV